MGNSPRPGLWTLEKSSDYGKSWSPWQHFSDSGADCEIYFGKDSLKPIRKDDDVICTTEFSKIVPLESGEVSSVTQIQADHCAMFLFPDYRSIAHRPTFSQQLLQLDRSARVDPSHKRSNSSAENQKLAWTSDERRQTRSHSHSSLLLLHQGYLNWRSLCVQWSRQHLLAAEPPLAKSIAGLLLSTQHLRNSVRAVLRRV